MGTLTTDPRHKDEIYYPDSDGEPMAESDHQRRSLIYLVEALGWHYRDVPDVYVSGNLFIYYEQGKPERSVAPDVFVVFDVPKHDRRVYKVWEEGKGPDVVIEITSESTRDKDEKNKALFSRLGVSEYFQHDPTGEYLKPPLQGVRLDERGRYKPIPLDLMPGVGPCLKSNEMDLLLCLDQGLLRLYDPLSGELLRYHAESEEEREQAVRRVQRAEDRARQAEERARAETRARQRLEKRLRELETRLKKTE